MADAQTIDRSGRGFSHVVIEGAFTLLGGLVGWARGAGEGLSAPLGWLGWVTYALVLARSIYCEFSACVCVCESALHATPDLQRACKHGWRIGGPVG